MSDGPIRLKLAESYPDYGFDGRIEKRTSWELEANPTTPTSSQTTVVLIDADSGRT
jgi:hypothetical protein